MNGILAAAGDSTTAQQVINALALGSVYALLAIGIAAVFSVVRLVNFAHGEIVTLGGFAMYILRANGFPWPIVVPLTLAACVLAAMATDLIAFRPLRGAPPTAMLLSTLALSIMVQSALLIIYGAQPVAIDIGDWTSDTFKVGGVTIQWFDVATVAVTAIALAAFTAFLRRSILGLAMRAAAEDFTMTRLMGISANRVIRLAFVVSGLLAGIATFFYIGTLGQVGWGFGFEPLLKGFIAAIIGGLGSLTGAAAGGFLLAALEVFFQVSLPAQARSLSTAIVFAIVIAVLIVRPSGIFASRRESLERV